MTMERSSRSSSSLALMPFVALAPFAVAALLAWTTVPIGTAIDWQLYLIAGALLLISGTLAIARSQMTALGRYGGVPGAIVFLTAGALLRQAAGGQSSGIGVIALIPVFYTALQGGGRRELAVVLLATAMFYVAPIVIIGAPQYPNVQYRAALLTVSIASIIGFATQRLVAQVRARAGEALSRGDMLGRINELMRVQYSSTQARASICEAARTIGEASVAILYEPVPGTDRLQTTAMAGVAGKPAEIPLDSANAVTEAFRSGRQRLITGDVEAHVGHRKTWEAAGRPPSVLYQPLMHGATAIGVLVVGWPTHVSAAGARAAVVAMLADETVAVIERADRLSELSDMASTDELTGLPNRRAWTQRLDEAMKNGDRFTIAVFDLDRFKDYNDTYGHPAGDLLLKETTAAWRDALRTGDLLARIGGEEFGLLMEVSANHAQEAIERLCGLVPRGQSCSVGVASRRPGESADSVFARADAALYEAKLAGRDRITAAA